MLVIVLGCLLFTSVYCQNIVATGNAGVPPDASQKSSMASPTPYEPQSVPEPEKDPIQRALRAKIGALF